MRAIALDLGSRRIGVAVSDSDGNLAVPMDTIVRSSTWAQDHRRIAELVREADAETVVVGMPLSMDGSRGPAARRTNKELSVLARTLGVPVEIYDERLSTVEAEGSLRAADLKSSRRSEVIDAAAAAVILQGWLDKLRGGISGMPTGRVPAASGDDALTDQPAPTDQTAPTHQTVEDPS